MMYNSELSPFFGYESNLISSPPLKANYLETRIHPDDLMTFSVIQKKLMELWEDLPADRRMNYKQVYELRVLNAENEYSNAKLTKRELQILKMIAEDIVEYHRKTNQSCNNNQ